MNESTGNTMAPGGLPLGALIRQAASASTIRALEADAALFRQGDAVREVYIVERGRLRLQRHTVEGVRLTLQTADPDDLLAAASLFAERYHCDAVSVEPSSIHVYSRKTILAALENRPELT